ncbi:MAG TPA: archaeal proteasome endopeptidase complex subunit beta [Thermofilum sp.]|nr:archaeal proteasome endopeptidase complex subunit beta [Thermofilum sp.]
MEYYPGATTVGIKVNEGVVLAADKRVTYGFMLFSRAGKKVFRITDKVGIASAGIMSDMQTIARTLEAEMRIYELETGMPIRVSNVAKLLSMMLFNRRIYPYLIESIVGGIDDEGSHLIVCDPIGAIIEDDYAALGTGAQVAIGIVENNYNKGLSLNEAKDLAVKAVKAAFSRDAVSGDGIDLLVISKEGSKEEFVPVPA